MKISKGSVLWTVLSAKIFRWGGGKAEIAQKFPNQGNEKFLLYFSPLFAKFFMGTVIYEMVFMIFL